MRVKRTSMAYLLRDVILAIFLFLLVPNIEVRAADVESAINWALSTASNDNIGYSQNTSLRKGPNYYDCSSFVSTAFRNAGFNVPADGVTWTMRSSFEKVGFSWIPWDQINNTSNLKRGDILLREPRADGHTEIYLGNSRMVGAHSANRAKADQVSECGYYYHPWDGVLRYNASQDIDGPCYIDFHVGEQWDGGFTVFAKVTDPGGVSQVRYAIWTENGGQDDINWYQGNCTDNNDYYWARITFSNHNGERGKYIIHMYAYDGIGNLTSAGISYLYDVNGPSFSDFHVAEIWDGGFTVFAKVADPNGISQVKYAIWTEKGGQDDIKWYNGHCFDNNGIYWERIKFSDHNREKGKYIIHLYAYDNMGNLTNPGIFYNFDSSGPTCDDFHVSEFWEGGFTVFAKVTDPNGISQVKYAIWTEKDGQDDIKWYNGHCFDNNDIYWERIKFSDHNGEKGKYVIHLYAYDSAGKLANPGISYIFKETGPTISNVQVSDVSSQGYTITCEATDTMGIGRVQFPTWTVNNSQDDLVTDWRTNKKVRGTIKDNIVTFRVNASDHNNESGMYRTHIYAYDVLGNPRSFAVPDVNVHDHVMEITNEIPATCTEPGSREKICQGCGKKTIDEIPAKGHIWDKNYTIDKVPTCTEEGCESIHCSVCNKINPGSSRTIAKSEHKYEEWVISREATCEDAGLKEKTCSNCGDKVAESIQAKGHIWNAKYTVDKEATCIEEGSKSIHCAVCDATKEDSSIAIEKIPHKYKEWVIIRETTCEEAGLKEKICSNCGDKVVESIQPKGHSWNTEYTVDKEATCTEEGSRSIHCSVCDAKKEDSSIAIERIPHKYGEWVITREATCEDPGSKEKICSNCGEKVVESIQPNGHSWNAEYTVDKEATCTEEGSRSIHCSVCDAIKEDSTIAIERIPHKYGEWVITREATCNEPGVRTYTCMDCGDTRTETIPAKGHVIVIDPATEATEDTTGLTEGSHCSVCNEIIKKQEVIPKLEKEKTPSTENPKEDVPTTETPGIGSQTTSASATKEPTSPSETTKAPDKQTAADPRGDVKDPVSIAGTEKAITAIKTDSDPKGSNFRLLQLRASKTTKNSNKLSWTKVKGASGYIIYGNMCNSGGKKYPFMKLAELKGGSKKTWTHKKQKKGTYYKYIVIAYQSVSGTQKVIASSKTIHVATTGGKVGNYKAVKVNKKTVKLKKGKTFKIKAKEVAASKKLRVKRHRKVTYESSDPKIATVSNTGKIKAKKKGSCLIYVYTQSGTFAKVRVKVV